MVKKSFNIVQPKDICHLREYIAERYSKNGLKVDADEILITNGSQQGIDLVSKVFLNKGDKILVENPTYLAAIQSFGLFEPEFKSISLMEDGADIDALKKIFDERQNKIVSILSQISRIQQELLIQRKRGKN